MPFTNIEDVTNKQPSDATGAVAFVNMQPGHAWESWACEPGFNGQVGRHLPVPQVNTNLEGLWIYTRRGVCQVIDNDWTITGYWGGTDRVVLIEKDEGAGDNVTLTVNADGNITMAKSFPAGQSGRDA